jgi:hypothetical protein
MEIRASHLSEKKVAVGLGCSQTPSIAGIAT